MDFLTNEGDVSLEGLENGINSATDNIGTYDKKNPDLRCSQRVR